MTVCVLTHCIFKYYMYIHYPQWTNELHILHVRIYELQWTGSVTYITCIYFSLNGLDQLHISHAHVLLSKKHTKII